MNACWSAEAGLRRRSTSSRPPSCTLRPADSSRAPETSSGRDSSASPPCSPPATNSAGAAGNQCRVVRARYAGSDLRRQLRCRCVGWPIEEKAVLTEPICMDRRRARIPAEFGGARSRRRSKERPEVAPGPFQRCTWRAASCGSRRSRFRPPRNPRLAARYNVEARMTSLHTSGHWTNPVVRSSDCRFFEERTRALNGTLEPNVLTDGATAKIAARPDPLVPRAGLAPAERNRAALVDCGRR